MAAPPDERTSKASITIDASPDKVYDLIVDVAQMGNISPESTGTIGNPGDLTVGDKFWGLNKRGAWRWFTRCTVLAADPGRTFEFDVDFGPMPVSRWRYDIVPAGDGCEVTETWEDRRDGALAGPIKAVGSMIIPGPRAEHNQANIEATLQRLKELAEAKG